MKRVFEFFESGGKIEFIPVLKILLIFAFVKLIYIAFIPITPQEAYYWYYSQNPDWSYFDHPPMAAYSILIGTLIFGNFAIGVKFMAVIWWLLTNILLFKVSENHIKNYPNLTTGNKSSLLVLLLFNLTFFGNLYSVTLVPDTPLLFFWLLIIYALQKLVLTKRNIWFYVAGVSFGLSLVSKYSGIIAAGSIFLLFVFNKDYRKYFFSPHLYLSFMVGILVFFPVIYWNYSNEWASFKFQFSERASKAKPLQIKYIIQLVISQFFLLTPLVFVWFGKSITSYFKSWKSEKQFDLYFFLGVPLIIIFTLVSLKSLVKMNWLLPGYMSLFFIVVFKFNDKFVNLSRLNKIGVWISISIIMLGYLIQIIPNAPLGEANTWSGWKESSAKISSLQQQMGGRQNCFIFGNSYKSASLIKFYLPDHQDTYAENIFGERALQFDYWQKPELLKGKNALYVFDDRKEYKPQLDKVKQYFDFIRPVQEYKYDFYGIAKTRTITVYYCENYHGTD